MTLFVPEHVKAYYDEVEGFARVNDCYETAPKETSVMSFKQAMHYLDQYGTNVRVVLGRDFAKNSFTVEFQKQFNGIDWSSFMYGGLIFHERDMGWSVHT